MMPDRYLISGLDAVCRAYRDNAPTPQYHIPEGFVDGHRGAGMIASYFLFKDGLVDPAATPALQAMLDREWMDRPLFAASPAEAPAGAGLEPLLRLLAEVFGRANGDPHHLIFPTLALRCFRLHPGLITPYRIEGLRQMITLNLPAQLTLERLEIPADQPAFDASRFSEFVLAAFIRAVSFWPKFEQSYCGHILTWGSAVQDLYVLGYTDLAGKAELSYRHYLRRCLMDDHDRFGDGKLRAEYPAHALMPDQAGFWHDRPPGNLEGTWAHLPKYAWSFLTLCRQAEDADLVARARNLYYLLVY